MPIFPKCANIGAVFRPTIRQSKLWFIRFWSIYMRLMRECECAVPIPYVYAHLSGYVCLHPSMTANLDLKSSRASSVCLGSEQVGRQSISHSTLLKSPSIICTRGRVEFLHLRLRDTQNSSFSLVLLGAYTANICRSSRSSLDIVSRAARPGIISLRLMFDHAIVLLFRMKATPAERVLPDRLLFSIVIFLQNFLFRYSSHSGDRWVSCCNKGSMSVTVITFINLAAI
jgi:hypothetical protein